MKHYSKDHGTGWKDIKNLVGNVVCVPVSTPDNYFHQASKAYAAKTKQLAELGKRVHVKLEHDKRWPEGPEAAGDRYLVEELGYIL